MPFIKCTDCGKLCSVKLQKCPKCGAMLSNDTAATDQPATATEITAAPSAFGGISAPSAFNVAAQPSTQQIPAQPSPFQPAPQPTPFQPARQQGAEAQGAPFRPAPSAQPAQPAQQPEPTAPEKSTGISSIPRRNPYFRGN